MNLECLSINHRTARVETRERMWFAPEDTKAFLSSQGKEFFRECVLVSTCNRTELYYIPVGGSARQHAAWMVLASFKRAEGYLTEADFCSFHSLNAAKHLFKLASGIDSMVMGDVQILGQIKTAFELAQESDTAGPILHKLFSSALHAGKRARTETGIGDGAVSVGYAAAELATKIFRDLSTKTALLIGAGETGELTAKHLHAHQLGQLLIANRTRERAEALCGRLNGTVVDFDEVKTQLQNVDIVISSIAVSAPVLDKADLQAAMKHRGSHPLVIIDLGVPRNVDPESGTIGNVFLHDIDSLNHVVDMNMERRRNELPKVSDIVLQTLTEIYRWHKSLQITPTIQDLRQRFEEIRIAEVEKYHHHFTPELQEEIGLLTRRIVNKILHAPMVNLRSEAINNESEKRISIVRSLFGLDVEEDLA